MKRLYALAGLLILLGFVPPKVFINQAMGQTSLDPVLSVTPATGDFYGTVLGNIDMIRYTLRNSGGSVLEIKKIEVTGDCFSLFDTNPYPFEIIGKDESVIPAGNGGKSIELSVAFIPIHARLYTGKLTITYGHGSDRYYEIELTGQSFSCQEALIASKGENWAPKPNAWFRYTADKFSIMEVNSCHPHQQRVGNDIWELYPYLFLNCCGRMVDIDNTSMGSSCIYNPLAWSKSIVLDAGETVYIFWSIGLPDVPHANEGFYFNIKVTYPTDGEVCENAIPLTLPVVNHFGTTTGFNDDYDISPCSPLVNYMGGNDKVYSITLPEGGYLTGNILGTYASIHVLDLCPKVEMEKFHCRGFAGGPNGGQFRKKIDSGTYYVIISNWSPPQTVDYLLNMSWESVLSAESDPLINNLNIYPNPTSDRLMVVITNEAVVDLTLEMVAVTGQIVYRNQVNAIYNFGDEIDVSRFPRGIYYLKVNNGKELNVRKVIIE
jgi:hypothetical protein